MLSVCPITGSVNFGHLLKVMSARFLYSQVTVSPCVIKIILWGYFLRICENM